MMFGKTTKKHCKIVGSLRKYGVVKPLDSEWSNITDSRLKDHCGWLIPNKAIVDIEELIFIETYLSD